MAKTHKLRNSDLNHHDRQNFGAVENIVKAAHLLDDIPEALGTRCYIDIIQSAVYSFLSKTMTPESRLENIWFATFMLRYWRQWILLHPTFTLQHNFITTNAYVCIEVNAHSLLSIVIRMRNGDLRSITPWDMGSQSCEHFFRSLRSMTGTFSTIINFSLLGILQRIHKLSIKGELEVEDTGMKFPRIERQKQKVGCGKSVPVHIENMTDNAIYTILKNAGTKAKNMAEKLGMDEKLKENNMWNIAPIPKNLQHLSVEDDEEEDDEQDNVLEGYDDYLSTSEAVSLLLKDIDNLHANEVIDSSVKERANAISKNIILPH